MTIHTTVEHGSVRGAIRAFGKASPELKQRLRPAMRNAGEAIRATCRPARRTRLGSRSDPHDDVVLREVRGVKFRVDAKKAPNARPLERGNLGGRHSTFRHPVFARGGNRAGWTWATQQTRPFFFPALKAGGKNMRKQITDAVQASLREVAR